LKEKKLKATWWKTWWIKKKKDNMVEGKKLKRKEEYLSIYKCEWHMWWWLQSSISLVSFMLSTFIYIDTIWQYYKMWVQFTNLYSMGLMKSLKIKWKHLASKDTFCCNVTRYIHGWGSQKDYLAPKSLSKLYFEWAPHLWNNLFGSFFSLDIHIHLDYNSDDLIMSHYAILLKRIQ
jgi:hypothetical protein